MERSSRRRFRWYGGPPLSSRGAVMPQRPWLWRSRAVALLVGLLLAAWVLPGSAHAAARGLGNKGSEPPVSTLSLEVCDTYIIGATLSKQVAEIRACVERLPGGVRAYFSFRVDNGGTANFKGTLHTCNSDPHDVCGVSKDFWLQGVGGSWVSVATAWSSHCPTTLDWWGYIRLLDYRFMPSGELHQGTGPYYSNLLVTNAC